MIGSQLALWQSYCEKKMECESLSDEVKSLREGGEIFSEQVDVLYEIIESICSSVSDDSSVSSDFFDIISTTKEMLNSTKEKRLSAFDCKRYEIDADLLRGMGHSFAKGYSDGEEIENVVSVNKMLRRVCVGERLYTYPDNFKLVSDDGVTILEW